MNSHSDRWLAYYELTRSQPPRPHLLQALEWLPADLPKTAIDMGCGTGRDTFHLLEQGFRVSAFDAEPAALARNARHKPGLNPVLAEFHTFDYHPASLINASSSLFFCEAVHFDDVWHHIRHSLHPRGLFCGQLLGRDDSWTTLDRFQGVTIDTIDLDTLFDGFEILHTHERNEPGTTALGKPKHWHYWTVIARKEALDGA